MRDDATFIGIEVDDAEEIDVTYHCAHASFGYLGGGVLVAVNQAGIPMITKKMDINVPLMANSKITPPRISSIAPGW